MRIVYPILYRVVLALAYLVAIFNPKLRAALDGRKGLTSRVHDKCSGWAVRPYWFHVASSGELEQAIPIMDAIKEGDGGARVFLSYFSSTAVRALDLEIERRTHRGLRIPWDYADYLPFDRRQDLESFVDVLRPSCFVSIHRELWPCLIDVCQEKKIPAYLFATHVSRSSIRVLRLIGGYFGKLSLVGTADEESALCLKNSFPDVPVRTLGDPRIERVFTRKEMRNEISWRWAFGPDRIFIAASIWGKDFWYLKPAFEELLSVGGWRLVLVPHEPREGFIRDIRRWFSQQGAKCHRWSEPTAHNTGDHFVVDAVGFLAELYQIATLVYVGGSAAGKVHNVLEPAAYGKPVLTGPCVANSQQAGDIARLGMGLTITQTPEELRSQVMDLVRNPERIQKQSTDILAYMETHRGAGTRYKDILVKGVSRL